VADKPNVGQTPKGIKQLNKNAYQETQNDKDSRQLSGRGPPETNRSTAIIISGNGNKPKVVPPSIVQIQKPGTMP